MSKLYVVVRVNRDPSDTHAAEHLGDALDAAIPDDGDTVEWGWVNAPDVGAARLLTPLEGWRKYTHPYWRE